jgi:hypothetical protein
LVPVVPWGSQYVTAALAMGAEIAANKIPAAAAVVIETDFLLRERIISPLKKPFSFRCQSLLA